MSLTSNSFWWIPLVISIIGAGGSLWIARSANTLKKAEIAGQREQIEQKADAEATTADKDRLLALLKEQNDQMAELKTEQNEQKKELLGLRSKEAIFYSHMYTMDRWANRAYDLLSPMNLGIDPPPQWPKELI
jgi:hypothetical protein